MPLQVGQVDEFQSQDMGGLKVDGRGLPRLEGFLPALGTHPQRSPGTSPGNPISGCGVGQVIPPGLAEGKKFLRRLDTDQVVPEVFTAGLAASGAVEPGHRIAAAFFHLGAEHVRVRSSYSKSSG